MLSHYPPTEIHLGDIVERKLDTLHGRVIEVSHRILIEWSDGSHEWHYPADLKLVS